METITVSSTRGFAFTDMELAVVSALVIGVIVWTVVTGLKHLRSRNIRRI